MRQTRSVLQACFQIESRDQELLSVGSVFVFHRPSSEFYPKCLLRPGVHTCQGWKMKFEALSQNNSVLFCL